MPSYTSNLTNLISAYFTEKLKLHPNLAQEVVGFSEYTFGGFANRTPITVANLLDDRFHRTFIPQVGACVVELRNLPALDKKQFHRTLLLKYLGLDLHHLPENAAFQSVHAAVTNAGASLPIENEDKQLHTYFLQPFLLFGIGTRTKKYANPHHNAWFWQPVPNCDSTPMLRTMLQAYLVCDILDENIPANKDFFDPIVDANKNFLLDTLKKLHTSLQTQGDKLTHNCDIQHKLGVDTTGGYWPAAGKLLNKLFPRYLDVASFYAIGRLINGQPRSEIHLELTRHQMTRIINPTILKFILIWLATHFNVTTSLFWVNTLIHRWQAIIKHVKLFIQEPQSKIKDFALVSLHIIPNLAITLASPLLIVTPALYGITSIPFTLLRTFCLNGPFNFLKSFLLLAMLDLLEFFKDGILCSLIAMPLLHQLTGTLTVAAPGGLLTLGAAISFTFLLPLAFFFPDVFSLPEQLRQRVVAPLTNTHWLLEQIYSFQEHCYDAFNRALYAANDNYFRLLGFYAIGGVALLNLSALFLRKVQPYLTGPQISSFITMLSPLKAILDLPIKIFSRFCAQASAFDLVPLENRQAIATIKLPQVGLFNDPVLVQQTDQLRMQLGRLTLALHLSAAQKKIILACYKGLEITQETTQASLEAVLAQAQEILADNLTPEEAQKIQTLLEELKKENPAVQQFTLESAALRGMGAQGNYQPSILLLQKIHEKKWEDVLSPALQAKCQRMETRCNLATLAP